MPDTNPPFELSLSSNADCLIFNDNWSPQEHYQASFNAQYQVSGQLMQNSTWAMIADWRKWLALTPEHERLCVRNMQTFSSQGLRHLAVLLDDHPVARWQLDKAQQSNPDIEFEACDDLASAKQWLAARGYDVDFAPVVFNPRWMYPSEYFEQVLDRLGADKTTFLHTPKP